MKARPSRCQKADVFTSRKSKRKNPEASSIDMLPDEVLIAILSCLTFKEAVLASVLSRRWRYLWHFRSSDIVFDEDVSRIELSRPVNLVNQVLALHQGPSVDKLVIRFRVSEPVDLVNQIMVLHRDPSVIKLMIRYITRSHLSPDLVVPFCDWIRFAMQKKVRVLELSCFGYNFLDLEKFLSISRAMGPQSSLASLTSFTLVDFDIKDEMIEHVLSICPRLEHLSLKGGKFPSNLSIVSPSLKSFSICDCSDLRTLTISAANLVSFAYMGHCWVESPPKLCFHNVPLLSELTMDGTYMHNFIRVCVHEVCYKQLVKLVLILSGEVITAMSTSHSYRTIPRLRHLKHLELVITVIPGASLLFYVFWVMACPFLSTLSVQFDEQTSVSSEDEFAIYGFLPYQRKRAQRQLNTYRHKHLKQVRLINFVGHMSNIEFAMDLLRISKSLEKLIINPKSDTHGIGLIDDYIKQLEANLPAGAALVIH